MRTIQTNVYKLEELSNSAKEKAIDLLSDINVQYNWWDSDYEDAKMIKLKITGFDIYKKGINISFLDGGVDTAHAIFKQHGNMCETYKLAENYLQNRDKLIDEAQRDQDGDFLDVYELDIQLDELDKDFLYQLGEEYLCILDKEYDYLTSSEAIEETIICNGYEFTEDGVMI